MSEAEHPRVFAGIERDLEDASGVSNVSIRTGDDAARIGFDTHEVDEATRGRALATVCRQVGQADGWLLHSVLDPVEHDDGRIGSQVTVVRDSDHVATVADAVIVRWDARCGPPRRVVFEPRSGGDERWTRKTEEWTGCAWRTEGREIVEHVALEGAEGDR